MNKLILSTALILISLHGTLFAQTTDMHTLPSRTESTFNPCIPCYIHIKDVVMLKDKKMVLELFRIEDYALLKNMDSILMNFRKDIAFYKDSLESNNMGNVRIDYVYNLKNNTRKIRFNKYPAEGQSFVKVNNDVSRLKIEQDTVHIVIENEMPLKEAMFIKVKGPGKELLNIFPYSIQLTFTLNNYTDVDQIIADKVEMKRIVDTLEEAKRPLASGKRGHVGVVSSVYRPYLSESVKKAWSPALVRYKQYNGVIKDELDNGYNTHDYLTADFNMGLGLIRNTLAPSADLGLQLLLGYKKYRSSKNHNVLGLYFQPIFFFDKNSNGDYITNTNAFVNLHWGEEMDNDLMGLKLRRTTFGVGYLVLSKGNYFKNTTMKVFLDLQLAHGVTLSPELIATDNFKQIFPGFTLKIF